MSRFLQLAAYSRFRGLHLRHVEAVERYRGALAGRTVFCVGTGPSIAKTDLSVLNGQCVLLLNNAAKLTNKIEAGWQGLVMTDYLRMMETRHEAVRFNGPKFCSTDRIFQWNADEMLFDAPFHFILPKHRILNASGKPHLRVTTPGGFSSDLRDGIYLGFSVVFSAMQIALHLGAQRIVLVGIDMDYTPKEGGAYFDKSISDNWPTFEYRLHARDHLIEARQVLAARRVNLQNATVGGAIDVLERIGLAESIGGGLVRAA